MAARLAAALKQSGRFLLGMGVGATILVAAATLYVATPMIAHRVAPGPEEGPDRVILAGADIARAGGRRVEIDQWSRSFRQTCRGTCDDIVLDGGGRVTVARILDAEGRCRACRGRGEYDAPEGNTWTVSGQPLSVERRRP